VTREVLTGHGIDDFPFPTHKSARLRLERFWKERGMEREKEGQVGTNTVHGRTDMQGRRGWMVTELYSSHSPKPGKCAELADHFQPRDSLCGTSPRSQPRSCLILFLVLCSSSHLSLTSSLLPTQHKSPTFAG